MTEHQVIKDFEFMLAHNKSGWTLLEYLNVSEVDIGDYDNVTGAFAVISGNGEYGPQRYVEAHVWNDRGIIKSR